MAQGVRPSDPFMAWGIGLAAVLFVMYVYPGVLTPVTPRFAGTCGTISLGATAEDVRVDRATGLAYFTYYDRSPAVSQRKPGTVMVLDLNATAPRARAALSTQPENFFPKGISLYVPENGPKRLFAISRTRLGRHSIEIFEQSASGHFAPVETIRDRLLWSPNAIVAVGPNQFYVTNDSGFRSQDETDARKYAQARLRQNQSTVLYYDGETMRRVAGRLRMANGIAVSNDGRTLYVSETGARRLRVYDRQAGNGALTQRELIPLQSAPDNLTVDEHSAVWIASHPRGAIWLRALADPSSRAPTQVLKFTPDAPRGQRVSEVYINDGRALSSGTVAATHGRLLLLGAYADPRLLLCARDREHTPGTIPPGISGPEKDT